MCVVDDVIVENSKTLDLDFNDIPGAHQPRLPSRVTDHSSESLLGSGVNQWRPDPGDDLAFPVQAFFIGGNRDFGAVDAQRRRPPREQGGDLGQLRVPVGALVYMGRIVEAHAKDSGAFDDRRDKLDVLDLKRGSGGASSDHRVRGRPKIFDVCKDHDLGAVRTEGTDENSSIILFETNDPHMLSITHMFNAYLLARMTSMLAGRFVRFSTLRSVPTLKWTESYAPSVSSTPSLAITSSPERTTYTVPASCVASCAVPPVR